MGGHAGRTQGITVVQGEAMRCRVALSCRADVVLKAFARHGSLIVVERRGRSCEGECGDGFFPEFTEEVPVDGGLIDMATVTAARSIRIPCSVQKGKLRLSRRLPLPDGPALLTVRMRKGVSNGRKRSPQSLPLFGIWSERREMVDVVAYVNSLRRKHEKRRTND